MSISETLFNTSSVGIFSIIILVFECLKIDYGAHAGFEQLRQRSNGINNIYHIVGKHLFMPEFLCRFSAQSRTLLNDQCVNYLFEITYLAMAIIIPHRFIERLLPGRDITWINTVVIGTFNPGLPLLDKLTTVERKVFKAIYETKKFQRFNQVRNFYDRPPNRFWKVFDFIADPLFYEGKPLKTRNPNGLKFYREMDRDAVFLRQKTFCVKNGIFITDMVRRIIPETFANIYDNFPDKGIENAHCEWNTEGILGMIRQFKPKCVLINFRIHQSIPKISAQVAQIHNAYPGIVHNVLSTSGAAGNDYPTLYTNWRKHIEWDRGPIIL